MLAAAIAAEWVADDSPSPGACRQRAAGTAGGVPITRGGVPATKSARRLVGRGPITHGGVRTLVVVLDAAGGAHRLALG